MDSIVCKDDKSACAIRALFISALCRVCDKAPALKRYPHDFIEFYCLARRLLNRDITLTHNGESKMIHLTPNAVKAIKRFMRGSEKPVIGLRLVISGGGCAGFQYGMRLEEEKAEDDTEIEIEGIKLLVDPFTHPMIDEVNIDFIDSLTHTGFKFDNPNAAAKCSCGSSFSL